MTKQELTTAIYIAVGIAFVGIVLLNLGGLVEIINSDGLIPR